MNLLHVITTMNPKFGGPGQGIRNYEYGLRNLKVHRDVLCLDLPAEVDAWSEGDLRIIALGKSSTKWYYHPKLKEWLRSHLQNYDAIIINGIWLFHSYAVISVIDEFRAKGINCPKVYIMPHGMLDPWFQKDKSRKLKALRNEVYWRIIEKKVINEADGLLFTCQLELELARTTFNGYHPKKELNIGYGIAPPPLFSEKYLDAFYSKTQLDKKEPFLLYLSRVHEKKGLDLIISAYDKLLQENKDLPNLVVAGGGIETKYGQQIYNTVMASPELKSKVHFVGMLQGDAKWGAFHACRAFILPSHQENFGIAVAEALACSKPVLISEQVNIWKEIKTSGSGIVENDSLDGVRRLLISLLSLSEVEYQKLCKNARWAYEKYFDVKQTAKNLVEAISSN